jgi:pimeloyl-ACP methyl ester carboxylesterase
MPFLDTLRLPIHYQEAGAGAEPIVFVHGNFGSWRWWKPVFERLRPGWRALAPDLRGCGDTPAGAPGDDRAAYGIGQLAEDLAGFVDGIGLGAFQLVGHSLGGAVALQYALDHPGRVRSLMLVAPPPPAGLAGMRVGTSKSARLMRSIDPGHRPSMVALQSSYGLHRSLGTNRLMLRQALPEMMPAASLEPAMVEALLADAARMSPDALVGFLQALHRWNVEAELHRLRAPTAILWGERDVLVPRAGLEEMARLLGGELLVWPDTGHSPQLERPDRFVDLLAVAVRGLFRKRFQRWLGRATGWCAATIRA